jgi:6-phosphogluconolactonase
MAKRCCILLAAALPTALGFTAAVLLPSLRPLGSTALSAAAVSSPCKPSRVFVEADAAGVKENVLQRLEEAAASAIAERGHFAMAIPGGSVLKMLEGTAPSWASETTLAFVNHKAVDVEDAALSTQAKANKLFLSGWAGAKVIGLGGSSDAMLEAAAYEDLLRGLSSEKLPRNADGVPQFDLMLIGVGDDGHVGSLYPGREEVLDASGRWVLPVQKATLPSITLSLTVMTAAKQVVVAACGVSEKYPQGKSDAMARAIEGEEDTAATFPAVVTIFQQSSI